MKKFENLGGNYMYIYKIEINNFRSIKSMIWKPNRDINVIIGANGCGKSTLATALDYLLNPYLQWYNKTLSEMDYYDRNTNNPITVEVWFKDVEYFTVDDGDMLLEHINEKDQITENGQELVLITKFIGDSNRKASHVIVSNGQEHPFRQTHKGVINYKYIEADREPLKELSFSNNSLLSKVIENDKLSDLIQGIISDFNLSSTETLMKDPDFKKALAKLERSYADFDLIANDKSAIGVEVTELTERKTLQAYSIVYKNKDMTNYIPLKYQSRGIKNLMLLLTLQEIISNNNIIYLEEPEQNLEPFMQRKIIKKISSLNNGQVFLTTHSIEVAKVYDFSKIFLMKSGEINNLPDLLDIDKKFKVHVERYAKSEILSGLFSKGVLLVEGDSELSGIPMFSQLSSNGLDDSGVEISSGGGKDNVYKYASYYYKCGVPIISLIDNDYDIESLLSKFTENNIDSLVLCQPKDYETSIISMPVFQEYWIDLFEGKYPFKLYKDNYIKPFISRDSKSDLLKQKYDQIQDKLKDIKTISELNNLLNTAERMDFQREFLHINLAGIVDAKDVIIYILDKCIEEGTDDNIPIAFRNIFKLISVYMKNNSSCENVENCVVNRVWDTSFSCNNLCKKCGEIHQNHTNVIQIKGE